MYSILHNFSSLNQHNVSVLNSAYQKEDFYNAIHTQCSTIGFLTTQNELTLKEESKKKVNSLLIDYMHNKLVLI